MRQMVTSSVAQGAAPQGTHRNGQQMVTSSVDRCEESPPREARESPQAQEHKAWPPPRRPLDEEAPKKQRPIDDTRSRAVEERLEELRRTMESLKA